MYCQSYLSNVVQNAKDRLLVTESHNRKAIEIIMTFNNKKLNFHLKYLFKIEKALEFNKETNMGNVHEGPGLNIICFCKIC